MARLSWTTVIGLVTLLVSIILFYHTFDDIYNISVVTAGRGPVFFPKILLSAIFLLSIGVIIEGFKEKFNPITGKQFLVVVATLGLTGLYIYAITAAGFLISTIIFVFILPWLLGYRDWKAIFVITTFYPVIVWYVFEKFFMIILPSSPWFDVF
jgi:hypothetical protein